MWAFLVDYAINVENYAFYHLFYELKREVNVVVHDCWCFYIVTY